VADLITGRFSCGATAKNPRPDARQSGIGPASQPPSPLVP